jgi:hypothetical protein
MRAEREMEIQMLDAARHAVTRFGRATSSPPQFGQTEAVASPQARQNVHSYEQMSASPSGGNATPQRSHVVRISSAISSSSLGRC